MKLNGLFQRTVLPDLERAMDLRAVRQRTYASNLANVSTPGYERKEARFVDELREAERQVRLRATDPRHFGVASPRPEVEIRPARDIGGEPDVDLDNEMVAIARNKLEFDLAARIAILKIAGLRSSIHGRR